MGPSWPRRLLYAEAGLETGVSLSRACESLSAWLFACSTGPPSTHASQDTHERTSPVAVAVPRCLRRAAPSQKRHFASVPQTRSDHSRYSAGRCVQQRSFDVRTASPHPDWPIPGSIQRGDGRGLRPYDVPIHPPVFGLIRKLQRSSRSATRRFDAFRDLRDRALPSITYLAPFPSSGFSSSLSPD